jgi:hypothetical protein
MQTICPWCDAEITWDSEIGVEDVCPYCENELTEYRSVAIEEEQPAQSENHAGDWVLCSDCAEQMIHVGTQTVNSASFKPQMWHKQPLIHVPFSYEIFICPSCDRVQHLLATHDKLKWQKHVGALLHEQ